MKTRVPDRITSHTRELGRLISTDRRQFGVYSLKLPICRR